MAHARAWLLTLALATSILGGSTGCDMLTGGKKDDSASDKKKSSNDDDDDDDDDDKKKKKKKKSKDDDDDDDKSSKKAKKEGDGDKVADNKPAALESGKLPDLVKILGTKKDGWVPPPLKKLKSKMTPAEADKVMPGAANVSEFGFAKVKGTEPGVAEYELYFAEKGGKPTELHSVDILFDPALKGAEFWNALVKHTQEKYGTIKQADIDKKILTWVSPGFDTAQLTEGIMDEGYTLKVTLPD